MKDTIDQFRLQMITPKKGPVLKCCIQLKMAIPKVPLILFLFNYTDQVGIKQPYIFLIPKVSFVHKKKYNCHCHESKT